MSAPSHRFPLLLLICISGMGHSHYLGADTELNIPGYRIHWNDEFEGTSVDSSRWDVNVGVNAWYERASDGRFVEPHWFNDEFEPWLNVGAINDERQYYSPDNVSVVDGILEIRADRETVADPVGWYQSGYHEFTSGKLNTADEFQFQFGIVKWRAQLPEGQGLWPALWMLNGPDPWFWDDEIDVMEAKGSLPNNMSSAHHFKVPDGGGGFVNQYNAREVNTGGNLQTSFHEYSLLWEPTSLTTWVDDQQVLYDTQAIPQNPMFLIMNAAVGGGFDGVPGAGVPFPTYFLIDWVRVWQEAPTPTDLASGGFEDYQGSQWANWNTFDDGNISVYTSDPLHGTSSVQIDRPTVVVTGTAEATGTNLLTDGTASEWRAWLNQRTAGGEPISGGAEVPANIPAVFVGDSATLSIHQTAPSPIANAVVYRELEGAFAQGRNFTFSGTVTIDTPFPVGASARAFIRIFNPDYSHTDVATSVINGGPFILQTSIPASGVPIVQIGLETTGSTGDLGTMTASALHLEENTVVPPDPDPDNGTGINQAVTASAGQTFIYGVLAANHPSNPIGPGAEGRLELEFLDAAGAILTKASTVIVDSASTDVPVPFNLLAVAPGNTAYARLSIARVTTDLVTDLAGSFITDTAFLHRQTATELPIFISSPAPSQTVNAGQSVNLNISISSPTATTYQWYHNGQKVGTAQNYPFTATPDSGGTYFVVATNADGPVIGAITEVTVLTSDSDNDLISDYDETFVYGTDPTRKDTDYDGASDYDEIFVLLTDPLDPRSLLKITSFEMPGDQIQLSFQSIPSVIYQLEGSANLSQWQSIGSPYTASGNTILVIEAIPVANPPLRFFRIYVAP